MRDATDDTVSSGRIVTHARRGRARASSAPASRTRTGSSTHQRTCLVAAVNLIHSVGGFTLSIRVLAIAVNTLFVLAELWSLSVNRLGAALQGRSVRAEADAGR
jgi:hypothetical protein